MVSKIQASLIKTMRNASLGLVQGGNYHELQKKMYFQNGELSDFGSYLPTIQGYASDILEMKVRLLD